MRPKKDQDNSIRHLEKEPGVDRREFVSLGFRTSLGTALGSFLTPIQSWATVFNTGAFWKRKITFGQIWSSGGNTYGELGDGTTVKKSSPVQVGSLADWNSVSAGRFHGLGIKTDGTLWAWGGNDSGRLGDGTTVSKSSPVQIGALTNWAQVSASSPSASGSGHSLAVKTDGTLWAWGYGGGRQITTPGTNRSSPIQVGTLTNWKQAGAGGYYSVALKTDGTIWSWGANSYGSNGLGTTTQNSSPMQVGSDTDWAKIAVGYEHVLAIKTNGTLWSWGNNGTGQLGIGNLSHRSTPVQVGSLTTWTDISAGTYHSLAIRSDGTLWGWGENYAGHASGSAIGTVSSPVQVGSLTDWSQVCAGYSYNWALKTNGTLWAWGDNSWGPGELGNNSSTNRNSPVQIGGLPKWIKLGQGQRAMAIRAP